MIQRQRLPIVLLALCPLALAACGRGEVASFAGRDPRLLWDAAGRLHVVYVENRAEGPAVFYRRLGPEPAGPIRVSPPGLATAASREAPPTLDLLPDGSLVTAYPVTRSGRWSSELRVQRSRDGGRSWSAPRLLNAPGDGAHSFISAATSSAGTLAFAWLDNSGGHMGLRTASTRDGATFTAETTADGRTCQCCGTALAAGRESRLFLAYRGLEAGDLRDFQVLRSAADPPAFEERARLSADGWRIRGCPETGARLAAAPDGTLWAAWFTGGGEPGVYVSSSRDGGARFAPRTRVTAPGHLGRHPEIGVLGDGRVAVLYEVSGGERPSIEVRLRDPQGAWRPPRTLAREGTYPRLATRGGRTAVAFTCHPGEETRVVVAAGPDLPRGVEIPECAARPAGDVAERFDPIDPHVLQGVADAQPAVF
jgi:hypothetical protein